MSDEIWTRDETDSPCVNICVIHPAARLCTGCLRSIDEITEWSKLTPQKRQHIMAILPDRQSQLAQRRGGRAARLNAAEDS